LSEVAGAISLALWDFNVVFKFYAPTMLKKFITGDGRANKVKVALTIDKKYRKFGADFVDINEPDNVYDAFAAAHLLNCELRVRENNNSCDGFKLFEYQKEILNKCIRTELIKKH